MNIALFFVTHKGIAHNLINIGEAIIQKSGNNLTYYEVSMDANPKLASDDIERKLGQLNLNDGIIFITDIFGSTPSNIAQDIADKRGATLISGVNLPMVIRLLNYRDESEQDLIKKALDGATESIQTYKSEH
jgi:PTS system ascorbate-specific IIA component